MPGVLRKGYTNVLKFREIFAVPDLSSNFLSPGGKDEGLDMLQGRQTNMKNPTSNVSENPITDKRPADGPQRMHQQPGGTGSAGVQVKPIKEELGQSRKFLNNLSEKLQPVHRQDKLRVNTSVGGQQTRQPG